MAIPSGSNFPTTFDSNDNLHAVHDGLRVRLSEDYLPGDTTIVIDGDAEIIAKFPPKGYITLTEQCSDANLRAVSFYYNSRTDTTFDELELLPKFTDSPKPKRITSVTQNVMAEHHNSLKDALIAIERFVGLKGDVSTKSRDGTLEARINFLRKIVLAPKAWFSVNQRIGIVPFTVTFTDLSFRLGTDGTAGTISYIWDFGDNNDISSISTIEVTDEVPTSSTNVIVYDLDGGTIKKTYTRPGIYNPKLTVINDFGENTVIFPELINARISSPEEATLQFTARSGQIHNSGSPEDGPYTIKPTIRTPVETFVDIGIPAGEIGDTGISYAGELLDGNGTPIDAVVRYTWSLADDLDHAHDSTTRALYSVGGIYDLVVRVDTEAGAYRITSYDDVIDVVEKTNLWLWDLKSNSNVCSYEFGLISESFKSSGVQYHIDAIDDFLDGVPSETQQKKEFFRNNGYARLSTTSSGSGGNGLLYWAKGRKASQSVLLENIEFAEYNGFTDTYIPRNSKARPWNWLSLISDSKLYFAFGGVTSAIPANTSPTNQSKLTVNLFDLSTTTTTLTTTNYKNGASELQSNPATFTDNLNVYGDFSVYRSTWKDSTGYFARNAGVGTFFRIKSFYKTIGVELTENFQNITKLNDIGGTTKTEGQLLTLSTGLYFFNNSGSVSMYSPASDAWSSGGPGANSVSFRSLQDTTVNGFDSQSNSLVAASDGDKRAYLNYDYSEKAFFRFNETDTTFVSVGIRPVCNKQWQMQIH